MSLLARRRAMMGVKESLPDQPIDVNLITSETLNYKLNVSTGNPVYASDSRYCDYIPIYPQYGYIYRCKHPNNRAAIACSYDSNKNFIAGMDIAGSNQKAWLGTVVNKPGAAYIRVSTTKDGAGGTTTFEVYRSAT